MLDRTIRLLRNFHPHRFASDYEDSERPIRIQLQSLRIVKGSDVGVQLAALRKTRID